MTKNIPEYHKNTAMVMRMMSLEYFKYSKSALSDVKLLKIDIYTIKPHGIQCTFKLPTAPIFCHNYFKSTLLFLTLRLNAPLSHPNK